MRRKVRSFNVVIEKDRDGFYVASVPELRGCHTQAKSLDVLLKRVREVVDLCLEVDSTAVDSPEEKGSEGVRLFCLRSAARRTPAPSCRCSRGRCSIRWRAGLRSKGSPSKDVQPTTGSDLNP